MKKKSEWFFGTSGKVSFIGSLILVLILCFGDNFIPGDPLISNFAKHLIVVSLIYAVVSLGINFHSGMIGETSLGHAAFYGIGAYTTAVLTVNYGWNFWVTIPVGMFLAMLVSIPMALCGQRVKGSFMVVITFAFAEILRIIANNTDSLGSSTGIPGVRAPELFGERITKWDFVPTNKDGFILLMYVLVVFLAYFTWRYEHSRAGRALDAIRLDPIAATAMGINVNSYKMQAMILSAVICSVAGSFYASFSGLVASNYLSATLSITFFTMLVIGGRRSIRGAILGAFVVALLPELLRYVQEFTKLPFDPWYILYGLMLVIIMRVRPQGLFGVRED